MFTTESHVNQEHKDNHAINDEIKNALNILKNTNKDENFESFIKRVRNKFTTNLHDLFNKIFFAIKEEHLISEVNRFADYAFENNLFVSMNIETRSQLIQSANFDMIKEKLLKDLENNNKIFLNYLFHEEYQLNNDQIIKTKITQLADLLLEQNELMKKLSDEEKFKIYHAASAEKKAKFSNVITVIKEKNTKRSDLLGGYYHHDAQKGFMLRFYNPFICEIIKRCDPIKESSHKDEYLPENFATFLRMNKNQLNIVDKGKTTPILAIAAYGSRKMAETFVKIMQEEQVELNINGRSKDINGTSGVTPLQLAVIKNDNAMVKFLLSKGADPNILHHGIPLYMYCLLQKDIKSAAAILSSNQFRIDDSMNGLKCLDFNKRKQLSSVLKVLMDEFKESEFESIKTIATCVFKQVFLLANNIMLFQFVLTISEKNISNLELILSNNEIRNQLFTKLENYKPSTSRDKPIFASVITRIMKVALLNKDKDLIERIILNERFSSYINTQAFSEIINTFKNFQVSEFKDIKTIVTYIFEKLTSYNPSSKQDKLAFEVVITQIVEAALFNEDKDFIKKILLNEKLFSYVNARVFPKIIDTLKNDKIGENIKEILKAQFSNDENIFQKKRALCFAYAAFKISKTITTDDALQEFTQIKDNPAFYQYLFEPQGTFRKNFTRYTFDNKKISETGSDLIKFTKNHIIGISENYEDESTEVKAFLGNKRSRWGLDQTTSVKILKTSQQENRDKLSLNSHDNVSKDKQVEQKKRKLERHLENKFGLQFIRHCG